ncbi:hypothetical protein [Leeuwenhoekiella palythoae]|uniref:hypothetical protein n=1 Tax=Leeuwenhoekiella palythoae TaxID=573501 RepID=UPI001F2DBC3D|nr:hypothetical protein [Leeuwenhoekiella palythoae]
MRRRFVSASRQKSYTVDVKTASEITDFTLAHMVLCAHHSAHYHIAALPTYFGS